MFQKKRLTCILVDDHFVIGNGCPPEKVNKTSFEFILEHQNYNIAISDMPMVPASELKNALNWEAKKIFSDYDESLLFDFYEQPSNHQSAKKIVNIVSVEKSHIERIKDKAVSEGFRIEKITIPEIMYKNHIFQLADSNSVCIVITNADIGKVIIIENNTICFSRKFGLAYQAQTQIQTEADDKPYEDLLLLELQRSLDYYERQYRLPLPKSFLVLGSAINDNITEIIKENISNNIISPAVLNESLPFIDNLSIDHRFLLSVCC